MATRADTLTADSAFALFLEECKKEYEQTQRELREIELLIKQGTTEVEKLAQRNAQAMARVRQVQTNLDTVPRADIRDVYEAAQDAGQRLFTMRGQAEKLQSDRRNLERYAALLQHMLEVSGESRPGSAAEEQEESGPPVIVRIVEAQEAERQRLTRQMHDGPAQSLTNFILQAEICQRLFEVDPQRARTELVALKAAATATFQKIRDFMFELRPMMLDDLGLVPTVRRYLDSFETKSGVETEFSLTGNERRLPAHAEVTVFRAIQELLTNARSHAQATRVGVALDITERVVRAVVEDNGNGFDVSEALATSQRKGGLGLATMRERIEMLGGQVRIESHPGQGTRVTLDIPLASAG